jgi:glycolate oxidase
MDREPGLAEELRKIVGDRASDTLLQRCCYSVDASTVKGSPDCIVRPISTVEVSGILRLCNEHGIPVTPRGAGTGLAGGAVPVRGGIVLDMSGMNRILEIDLRNLQVIAEPGVIHERLNLALKPHGFFFPPDPGSSEMCTIGGMISNNSSGMRSVKYGTTRSYVLDLEVVLADGRIIRTGSRTLKTSAGYDLTRLIVGSEGTLGIVTRAGLRIAPLPKARRLLIALFEDASQAGLAVTKVFSSGITPSACEILDRTTLQVLKRCDAGLALPDAGDVILFEADGTEASASESIRLIEEVCRPAALELKVASDQREMNAIWAARRLVGAAVSRLDPSKSRVYMGEDVGVPLGQIPELIRRVEDISRQFGIPAMKYGHIGDGNLHVALFIDVMDPEQWERLRGAADKIHRAALELGGTVSSEHGIGLARAQYMEGQLGEALEVMRAIKRALDPKGILNPGKMAL